MVLAALAILVAAGCGDDSASLPPGTVARVGDADISQKQLDAAIAENTAAAQAQGQSVPKAGESGYDQFRAQVLQNLIREKIVDFEARACGRPCAVTPAEIAARKKQIIAQNFGGKQSAFDTFVKQRKYSAARVSQLVRSDVINTKLLDHVTRGVRFTAADAKTYYDQNKSQFTTPAGRDVKHILVATKAEADMIRAQVTPANFAELAKRYSTDTGTKNDGGELGSLQKGQFVKPFETAALKLKDGEISQPVKTQFGWHIIYVTITPAHTTTFAQAKAQIISSQLAQKRQDAYNAWGQKVLAKWDKRTVYASKDLVPTTASATATAPVTTSP
jgi:parvulin-like peptidyl-prolyl isomerase